MTHDELKLVLEALEKCRTYHQQDWSSEETTKPEVKQAITAIKEALAQPKQEPVAWMDADGNVSDNNDHNCFPLPLYTTPQQRKPLTQQDLARLWMQTNDYYKFARAIEAELKQNNGYAEEKNTPPQRTDKERILQLIKELRPAIKPLEGMGRGKTTEEWFDILVQAIEEKNT